jgi:hypothetical protein
MLKWSRRCDECGLGESRSLTSFPIPGRSASSKKPRPSLWTLFHSLLLTAIISSKFYQFKLLRASGDLSIGIPSFNVGWSIDTILIQELAAPVSLVPDLMSLSALLSSRESNFKVHPGESTVRVFASFHSSHDQWTHPDQFQRWFLWKVKGSQPLSQLCQFCWVRFTNSPIAVRQRQRPKAKRQNLLQ